jgi:hypothetical protein
MDDCPDIQVGTLLVSQLLGSFTSASGQQE